MAHPSVGGRSVGNYLVFICHHPFLVYGEGPEGLRAPTEFLDVHQRRGLVRKTSELGRFVTIVCDSTLDNLSVAVEGAKGIASTCACNRSQVLLRGAILQAEECRLVVSVRP